MFLGKDSIDLLVNPPVFQVSRTYTNTSSVLTGNGYITNYNNVYVDTHSGFSGGYYTIPIAGLWYIEFFMTDDASSIGDIFLYLNGADAADQFVTRHYNRDSSSVTFFSKILSVGDVVAAYLNYTTSRNNNCTYQFSGFMKRGM